MSRVNVRHALFVAMLAVALVSSLGVGVSLAADGNTIPHGGYENGSVNPMTDACLQCHDVHEAAGEYVLTRETTVTGTCSTCHNIYLGDYRGGLSPFDPGYPSLEASNAYWIDGSVNPDDSATGSFWSAYQVDESTRTTHEGHRLGQGRTVASGDSITYADGTVTTNANYIPGGTTTLTRVESWLTKFTGNDADDGLEAADTVRGIDEPTAEQTGINALPNTGSGTSGLYCASCHGPHGEFGNVLPESVYDDGTIVGNYFYSPTDPTEDAARKRGKILSSRPNHDPTGAGQVSINSYINEAQYWCVRCHDKRDPDGDLDGNQHNNHPPFCLECHGIYSGTPTDPLADPSFPAFAEDSKDFPHTGSKNLLQAYPDELCLRCHGPSGMPMP